jgi:hypothetical protein
MHDVASRLRPFDRSLPLATFAVTCVTILIGVGLLATASSASAETTSVGDFEAWCIENGGRFSEPKDGPPRCDWQWCRYTGVNRPGAVRLWYGLYYQCAYRTVFLVSRA